MGLKMFTILNKWHYHVTIIMYADLQTFRWQTTHGKAQKSRETNRRNRWTEDVLCGRILYDTQRSDILELTSWWNLDKIHMFQYFPRFLIFV